MLKIYLFLLIALSSPSGIAFAEGKNVSPSLSLMDVMELVMQQNPGMKAHILDRAIAAADKRQKLLLINPEFSYEVENGFGTGSLSGSEAIEQTISLSQKLVTGGKRSRQSEISDLTLTLSGVKVELARSELIRDAHAAFVHLLVRKEGLILAMENVDLAREILAVVRARKEAGRISPVEEIKAEISLETLKIRKNEAEGELLVARSRLANLWGGDHNSFGEIQGELTVAPGLPEYSGLLNSLPNHPLMRGSLLEKERRAAELKLAGARKIPDISISGGFRKFHETGDHAYVAGISLELPLFNRGQGEVQKADFLLEQSELQTREIELALTADLAVVFRTLQTSHATCQTYISRILPDARKAFESTREGYRHGKFDYLEVLDSQRTFTELQENHLLAMEQYQISIANIYALTGNAALFGLARTSHTQSIPTPPDVSGSNSFSRPHVASTPLSVRAKRLSFEALAEGGSLVAGYEKCGLEDPS